MHSHIPGILPPPPDQNAGVTDTATCTIHSGGQPLRPVVRSRPACAGPGGSLPGQHGGENPPTPKQRFAHGGRGQFLLTDGRWVSRNIFTAAVVQWSGHPPVAGGLRVRGSTRGQHGEYHVGRNTQRPEVFQPVRIFPFKLHLRLPSVN